MELVQEENHTHVKRYEQSKACTCTTSGSNAIWDNYQQGDLSETTFAACYQTIEKIRKNRKIGCFLEFGSLHVHVKVTKTTIPIGSLSGSESRKTPTRQSCCPQTSQVITSSNVTTAQHTVHHIGCGFNRLQYESKFRQRQKVCYVFQKST